MKQIIFFLFLLAASQSAFSQFYWGSIDGKDTAVNLTKRLGNDQDAKSLEFGTINPSVVATQAGQGSIFISTTSLFQKQDNGLTTNWLPLLIGPTGSGSDECLARWDGTGVPVLQNSIVCITDLGAVTGALSLAVGNLSLSGNTLASSDVNGNIILNPNGTGQINFPDLTPVRPLKIDASNNVISGLIALASSSDVTGVLPVANGGTNSSAALNNNRIIISSAGAIVEATAITGNRALVSNASGIPVHSATTDTEIGYVSGVTSGIQSQLNGKEPTLSKGNLTSSTPSLSITNGTLAVIGAGTILSVSTADTTTAGIVSSADWNTFNNKQAAGSYITALSGDVVATGPGAVAATIQALAVTNAKIANSTIDLTTKVTGLLPLANGGTNNNITAAAGRIFYSDATRGLLTTNLSINNATPAITIGTMEVNSANTALANTATNGNVFIIPNGTGRVFLTGNTGGRPIANRDATYDYEIGSALNDYSILSRSPSFERTVAEGTCTNCTASQINTTEGNGQKSLQIVSTASTAGQYRLDSLTGYSTSQQGSILAGIKTSSSGVSLISRSNGVTVNSVSLPTNGYNTYELPVVCGTTSCGYDIAFDNDAEVETIEVTYAYPKIGDVKNTSSVVTAWQVYTAVITGFGATSSHNIKYRQSGQSLEISGTFVGGTSTGVEARISLPTGFTGSSQLSALEFAKGYINNTATNGRYSAMLIEPNVAYLTISYQDNSSAGYFAKANGNAVSAGATHSFFASFPVNELAGNVTTISQPAPPSAQIKWANVTACSFTTSSGSFVDAVDTDCTYASATTLGSTVTPSATGGLALKIPTLAAGRYKVTVSSEMASVGSAACGFQLVDSANSKTIGPQHTTSNTSDEGFTGSFSGVVEYSATVANVEFKLQAIRNGGAGSCRISINDAVSSTSISIEPIAANIVGNFANTMNTSSGSAHDFFTFSFGTTNLATNCTSSPCFLDQGTQTNILSVSREGTGLYTLNFSKTYAKIWCLGKGYDTTQGDTQIRGYVGGTPTVNMCSNCNSLRIQSYHQTVNSADVYATISCHGY